MCGVARAARGAGSGGRTRCAAEGVYLDVRHLAPRQLHLSARPPAGTPLCRYILAAVCGAARSAALRVRAGAACLWRRLQRAQAVRGDRRQHGRGRRARSADALQALAPRLGGEQALAVRVRRSRLQASENSVSRLAPRCSSDAPSAIVNAVSCRVRG